MPKRIADEILTAENFDQELPKEERGEYIKADISEISGRKIIKARRSGTETLNTSGVLKTFSGFGSGKPAIESSKLFNFNTSSKTSETVSNINNGEIKIHEKNGNSEDGKQSKEYKKEYLQCLSDLNVSVCAWISKHVNENKCCILSPIFEDYKKLLSNIEEKYGPKSKTNGNVESTKDSIKPVESKEPEKATFSFGKSMNDHSKTASSLIGVGSSTPKASEFKFGAVASSKTEDLTKPSASESKPLFQFGINSSTTSTITSNTSSTIPKPNFKFGSSSTTNDTSSNSLFKFGGSTDSTSSNTAAPKSLFNFGSNTSDKTDQASTVPKFSFGQSNLSLTVPPASSASKENEDEEYVPPEPEKVEMKEDNSQFEMKCKLFYKAGTEWKDRGLGKAFIKKIDDASDKFQLLVRADTSLGNILLNIVVNQSMPLSTMKNNVSLACVPNPPLPSIKGIETPKPGTPCLMLLRVKTEDMAKELLSEMNKHRGKIQ